MYKTTQEDREAIFKRWVMTAFENDFAAHSEPRKKAVSPNDIDFGVPVKEVPIAKILPDLVVDDEVSNHTKEEGITVEDVPLHEVDESLLQGRIIRGEEAALAGKINLSDLEDKSQISVEASTDMADIQKNGVEAKDVTVQEEIPKNIEGSETQQDAVIEVIGELEASEEHQLLESVEDATSLESEVQVEDVSAENVVQVEDVSVENVVPKKAEPRAIVSQATIEDVHELISSLKKEAKDTGYREGIEQGLIEGQQEGIKKGFEEGLKKGLEQGRTQGQKEAFDKSYQEESEKANEYIVTLKQLTGSFQSDLQKAHESIANDVLELAIDLAKAMVKEAVHFKPSVIIPIVKDAVDAIPSLQRPAKLCLNKDDIPLVQKALGSDLDGWQLVEASIERGSCQIETGTNQIDNQLETRWKRLMANLGQTTNWVE